MVKYLSQWMTPNQLTILRILLIPVIFALTYYDTKLSLFLAAALFTFACLTDYFDGEIARYQGSESRLGMLLDPVADKVIVSAMLIVLVFLHRIDPLVATILISREFAVSGLRSVAVTQGVVISASQGGKIKTTTQMFALGFLILHYPWFGFPSQFVGNLLLSAAVISSLWTGGVYFWEYRKAFEEKLRSGSA